MSSTAKPDALVAGVPHPTAWVLIQTSPKFEVLGVSSDKVRVSREMDDLCALLNDAKLDQRRFSVVSTNMLFA